MNYAALHFPDFELNCQLVQKSIAPSQAAALLSEGEREKSHLILVNQAARDLGIEPGMRTIRGLARCADLQLLTTNTRLIHSTQKEILSFAESFTPDFEHTTSDTILLDLSTLLIASEESWIQEARAASCYLGLPLQIGLGPTPDQAHLASFEKNYLTLTLTTLAQKKGFPLNNLKILQLWGARTLGELAQLPRQGLAERLGRDLARLHDIIHGKEHRLLKLHQAQAHFAAQHLFEPPVPHHEPILFIAKRLLKTLCNRLHHHQRAACELYLHLGFENGAAHFRKLTMAEPTLSDEVILRQLHTHLDSLKAPAPISEFHLKLIPALPLQAQHQLFQRGLKDPNQFHDTLRRLGGIVGESALGIPQSTGQLRPDSVALHPYGIPLEKAENHSVPERPTLLPLSRKRPPIRIHVASEQHGRYQRPLAILTGPHQGTIQKSRGPFPLSGSWWDRGWQQAQWDVELADHLLLQLTFYPPTEWELTGIYG